MAPTFQITFDIRTKEVLLDALGREQALAEEAIRSGDYSREAMIRYEEILRIRRGILFSKPEESVQVDKTSGN
jgi:hypothetical protein